MAAAAIQGIPRCARAAPPELERSTGGNAADACRVRRRVGPDRRAEVPVFNPAEPGAECPYVLLSAPARSECGAVVEARVLRRSLQLSLFSRRAAAFCRGRPGRGTGGGEGVRVREQSFLGEVGGERRDSETRSRSAAPG